MAKSLKITQVRNAIGNPQTQWDTMSPSDLKKIHQSVMHPDDPAVRGQIHKVRHLVTVEEIS